MSSVTTKKKKKIKVDFYFDIVCPHAHLASTQINALCANFSNVELVWRPIFLAGLYEESKSLQGKHKSSASVLPSTKRLYFNREHNFQLQRLKNVIQKYPSNFPFKTLSVMRLLTAMKDDKKRMICAQQIFNDIWVENKDINDALYLSTIAQKYGTDINLISDQRIKDELRSNTKFVVKKFNMFGVPSIVINNKEMFWGLDRFPFVEQFLRKRCLDALPIERILSNVCPISSSNSIEFWFDFASPWAFLGYRRLSELKNIYAKNIIFRPVLLGAIFKAVGTLNTPMAAVGAVKRRYMQKDFARWFSAAGLRLKMPSNFPLRTILPLRVFIVDERSIDCIYRAAWQSNVNIGNEAELRVVLDDNGFDGCSLIKRAKNDLNVKQVLRRNTDFAVNHGIFGVPTYVVNNDYQRFIWGQNRLDWIKDMCCGWKPTLLNLTIRTKSKI